MARFGRISPWPAVAICGLLALPLGCVRLGFGPMGDDAEHRGPDVQSDLRLRLEGRSGDRLALDGASDRGRGDAPRDNLVVSPGTILFVTTATHDAALGGRSGLDAFALANRPAGLTCRGVRALASVSATDEMRGMPEAYAFPRAEPIYAYHSSQGTRTRLANNWNEMLAGTILAKPSDVLGDTSCVWTGTLPGGAVSEVDAWRHCTGWTSNVHDFSNRGGGGLLEYRVESGCLGLPPAAPEDSLIYHWLWSRQYEATNCSGYQKGFYCETQCRVLGVCLP